MKIDFLNGQRYLWQKHRRQYALFNEDDGEVAVAELTKKEQSLRRDGTGFDGLIILDPLRPQQKARTGFGGKKHRSNSGRCATGGTSPVVSQADERSPPLLLSLLYDKEDFAVEATRPPPPPPPPPLPFRSSGNSSTAESKPMMQQRDENASKLQYRCVGVPRLITTVIPHQRSNSRQNSSSFSPLEHAPSWQLDDDDTDDMNVVNRLATATTMPRDDLQLIFGPVAEPELAWFEREPLLDVTFQEEEEEEGDERYQTQTAAAIIGAPTREPPPRAANESLLNKPTSSIPFVPHCREPRDELTFVLETLRFSYRSSGASNTIDSSNSG